MTNNNGFEPITTGTNDKAEVPSGLERWVGREDDQGAGWAFVAAMTLYTVMAGVVAYYAFILGLYLQSIAYDTYRASGNNTAVIASATVDVFAMFALMVFAGVVAYKAIRFALRAVAVAIRITRTRTVS